MNSRGRIELTTFILIIVAIVGVCALVFIGAPRLFKASGGIFSLGDSAIGKQGLTYKNPYYFTAEQIGISETSASSKCSATKDSQGIVTELQCKKDSKQDFSVSIANNAEVDRTTTYHGEIVVCNYGDKKCCEETTTPSAISSEDCTLKPGETLDCNAGTYTFTEPPGKYEVHPIADCLMDPEVGCYEAGMTSSVKSCNQDKSIVVVIT